ncbi:MAG: SH3 domain-containing protein [Desulfopila sp.]|jgi:SH3-like domain-containing protein|nr:SH3 domain-containing protein [Desulfopila sp.]
MFSKKLFFQSIAAFSFVLLLSFNSSAEMLSVKTDSVNLRSGPGTNFDIKWEYGKGFPLEVVSKKGDWVEVSDFEGDVGWIYKPLLSDKGHMIVKVNKDKDSKINIRSGPGTKYSIVGKAYYGVVFETLEQRDGWARVKHETGLVGWIKRTLIWGF